MYYEFYIDVFFVVNLVMDFLMLRLVNRVVKGNATSLRALAGAALGAAGMCVIMILPVKSPLLRVVLSHGLLGIWMVKLGCGCRTLRNLASCVLTLYAVSFLTGGILLAVPGRMKEGITTFLVITTATYWIISICMRLLEYLKGKNLAICQVTVCTGGKCMKVKGLYDTGNRLQDMITGKPVCVMEYGEFQKILSEVQRESIERLMEKKEDASGIFSEDILPFHPHFISYRSVGMAKGLMLAVTVDELYVSAGEGDRYVKRAVLGLVKDRLSECGNFQMIINPGILDS